MPRKKESEVRKGARRILLIDDHPLVIEGLKHIINQDLTLAVCASVTDTEQAVPAVEQWKPDLVIVDPSLQGNGLQLIKTLRSRYPELLILALSRYDESVYAERVLQAGVRGYLVKIDATPGRALTAIHQILSGKMYFSEDLIDRMVFKVAHRKPATGLVDSLSDRELEVFRLIGEGYRIREVAKALHLSARTIEAYREHIKEKLGLKDAGELTRYAVHWIRSLRTP